MKVVMLLIDAIFWLWLFIVPAGILGFVAFLIYNQSSSYLLVAIPVAALGIYLGIRLAEYVRKKYGVVDFFGKLLSTPELEEKRKS